jgi:hypothetical protein
LESIDDILKARDEELQRHLDLHSKAVVEVEKLQHSLATVNELKNQAVKHLSSRTVLADELQKKVDSLTLSLQSHSRGVPAGVTGGLVLHCAQPAADACPKPRCKHVRSGAMQRAAGCAMRHAPRMKKRRNKTPLETSRTGLRFQQIGERAGAPLGAVTTSVRTATRFCNFHSPAPRLAGCGVRENRESVCKL